MSTSAGLNPTVPVLNPAEERQLEAQAATRRGSTSESISTLQPDAAGEGDTQKDSDKAPAIPTHHANGLVDQTSYMCAISLIPARFLRCSSCH